MRHSSSAKGSFRVFEFQNKYAKAIKIISHFCYITLQRHFKTWQQRNSKQNIVFGYKKWMIFDTQKENPFLSETVGLFFDPPYF